MRPQSSLRRRWQLAAELRGSRKGGSDVAAQFSYCIQCHKKYPTHQKLFDTLYNYSRTAPDECPGCGGARDLHIGLDFQLGSDYKVVSALLPEKLESWMGEEQEEVTFYPFLIVLETEGKQVCWMPYWHVTGKEARYGQHAVCPEQRQFESLMAQVQEKLLEPV
jgi:hypothetical protein